MEHRPQRVMIPVLILGVALCGCIAWLNLYAGLIALGVFLIVWFICYNYLYRYDKQQHLLMDQVFEENNSAAGKLIKSVSVPCMLFNMSGFVVWRNTAMKELFSGDNIKNLPTQCNPKNVLHTSVMQYNASAYQVVYMPVQRRDKRSDLVFEYWLDRTETEHYSRLYEEQMPRVALIYVDNYEELTADMQFHRNAVLNEVERLVAEMTQHMDGIYRRYDTGRFVLVFEAKHLRALEADKFQLLEKAHAIDTGTGQSVTLSIAVGVAPHINESDEAARQAMELALGRGGDQAVVKAGAQYSFYGGRQQVETHQSRVKTRLFAKALRQLIENASEVFVMGHRQPDLDCMGAALGIYRCAKFSGCRCYIVLEQSNTSIDQVAEHLHSVDSYNGVLVSPEQVHSMLRPSSVLIVVDTQRECSAIDPTLVQRAGKLVLIDHHRRSADYIDSATLNYLEARASSASEMVTETIQYYADNVKPTAFESSTLLAGITVDTKHFAFNVGARTFEAAAFLRKNGADISMVKMMFQDDKETVMARMSIVTKAKEVAPGVLVATCPSGLRDVALIAAQSADSLISIRGNEASFVLCQEDDYINISGRSLGHINVQVVLEQLGGGGHLTMAGAQLHGVSMRTAEKQLTDRILQYMEENKESVKIGGIQA